MSAFNLLNRGRPISMGGIAPIPPQLVCDMADRLQWPCQYDEAIHVITAMDDAFRERHQKKS